MSYMEGNEPAGKSSGRPSRAQSASRRGVTIRQNPGGNEPSAPPPPPPPTDDLNDVINNGHLPDSGAGNYGPGAAPGSQTPNGRLSLPRVNDGPFNTGAQRAQALAAVQATQARNRQIAGIAGISTSSAQVLARYQTALANTRSGGKK